MSETKTLQSPSAMMETPTPHRPSLKRDFLLAPITALASFTSGTGQHYLLVGEDTDLKIYDPSSNALVYQFPVFSIQSIHGIHVRSTTILIWGNQSVAAIPSATLEARLAPSHALPPPRVLETRAPDWIFDGALPADGTDGRCFLVTAHNEVLEVTWDATLRDADSRALRFGRVIFPARPALYSARLACSASGELLVAGGTVFGEIVVWRCLPGREDAAPEVLFIFSGHEGSIFGVDFSDEVMMPDGTTGRLLASCSDDRTVRVWDVSEGAARGVLDGRGFYEARETGFLGVDAALSAVQDRTGAEVAVAMGHISRIWGVRFGNRRAEAGNGKMRMPVYSFGEDSTVWKWQLDVDVDGWQRRMAKSDQAQGTAAGDVSTLTHEKTFAYHGGKHIWAADLTHTPDGRYCHIATGGADGRVNIITDDHSSGATPPNNNSGAVEPLNEFQIVAVQDLLSTLELPQHTQTKRHRSRKTMFQRFVFLANDSLLAVTNEGLVLLGTFGPSLSWRPIPSGNIDVQDLAHCSALISPAPGVAVLGTTTRKLLLYQNEKIVHVGTFGGMVADLFCVDPISPDDERLYQSETPQTVEILALMRGGPDVLQRVTVDLVASFISSLSAVPGQKSHYVASSARLLSRDVLAIGSRHGHVSLFKVEESGRLQLLTVLERDTGDSITTILPLPGQAHSLTQDRFFFLTTSRDGFYRLYESLPSPSGTPTTTLIHENSSPAVPAIENAWFTTPSSPSGSRDLILAGFRGKTFILHNETLHTDLASLDCGGGHRAFAHRPLSPSDPSRLRLAFSRNPDLGLHAQHGATHTTPKTGTHGREIRALAAHGPYIATASEDTTIRLWTYAPSASPSPAAPLCLASLKVHRAGIQALQWAPLPDATMLFSCGGNEEFIAWRVRSLPGTGGAMSGPAVVKEAVLTDTSPDRDLRIVDLAATPAGGPACLVTMAFSNSTFKTYSYTREAGFHLLAQGRYTGACITKIRVLANRDGVLEVLTAASDGHVAIWTARLVEGVADYTIVLVTGLHQNAIKALDMRVDDARGTYSVVTGGDDNALVVTELRRAAGEKVSYAVVSKHGVKSAHAAAINALVILPQTHGTGDVTFQTASSDQRLKTWRVQRGAGGDARILLLGDKNSAVADPGDLAVVGHDEDGTKVMVVGVGMEVWHFSDGEKGVSLDVA